MVGLALTAVLVAACMGSSGADVPDRVSTIDDHVAHLRRQGFAGALLVARDGDITAEAFGLAHRPTGVANTVDTAFDIGSIAKMFTAAAVLTLVDEGRLSLDDTLGDLLDDVPADKRDITVRQLLDFSSGLGEYHDTEGDFEAMTRDQARERILAQELRFEPGTDTAYSNSSYTLAAIIVEQVTSRTFVAVVDELCAGAGLDRTGFYGSATLRDLPVATGYEGDVHGSNSPASWELTWALVGAGGMASTVEDLDRWWRQLFGPKLLRPDSRRLLEGHLGSTSVGGVEVRGVGGTNDFGFDASIVELVGRDTMIVAVSNGNPPDRTIAADASRVFARLLGATDEGDG